MPPLAKEVPHPGPQHMSEHPREMLLLVLLLVRAQPQLQEALIDALFEQPAQDLEGRLHGMLASLTVTLLEGLAEVEELRETVGQLETLEATREFKGFAQEGLGQLSS